MTDNPTRRDALKALAAATGAVTLASLPTHWAKPALNIGAIPAHAQVSVCFDLIIDFVATGDGRATYALDLPDPDEGPLSSDVVANEDGRWVWYCGLDTICFAVGNNTLSGNVATTLTPRNGPTIGPLNDGPDSTHDFTFNASDGTLSFGCVG